MSKIQPEKRPRPLLRFAADRLTDSRHYGSFLLAGEIVGSKKSFRSWWLAGQAGALMLTDLLDGYLGRRSNIPSSVRDDEADKSFYRNHMLALALKEKDLRYIGYAAANEARNVVVQHERNRLRDADLDADSRFLGKAKTVLQNLGIFLDLSPIGDRSPDLVHKIHQTAIGLTALSGVDVVIDAERRLSQLQTSVQLEVVLEAA